MTTRGKLVLFIVLLIILIVFAMMQNEKAEKRKSNWKQRADRQGELNR